MKTKVKFSPGHYLDQLIVHIDALDKQKKKVRVLRFALTLPSALLNLSLPLPL